MSAPTFPQGPDFNHAIDQLLSSQRENFRSGKTRPLSWRRSQLETLRQMVDDNREAMHAALVADLGRNRTDSDLIDVNYVVREADYALRHLKAWVTPSWEPLPLAWQPGSVRVRREPFGVALIIGAWNEPYMLTLGPAVAALAAGNTVVIKPSEVASECAQQLQEMVGKYFSPDDVAVVTGDAEEATALLRLRWDFIFFTGSSPVGKVVYQAAAKNLTPCVLELGGKNPTIVHKSADIKVAARRIAFGRFMNAGQICTAPDHILVWPEVKDAFIEELGHAIREFYGTDPHQSADYGRIINTSHFDRIIRYLGNGTIAVGGRHDREDLYIEPTILVDVPPGSPVMDEEVFGPVLPIFEVASVKDVIRWVNDRPAPLGLYIFTGDEEVARQILSHTQSGDACINDCTVHPMIPELPFGGAGASGFGSYHGRHGFEAFTSARGVFTHSTAVDPDVKYPPYSKNVRMRRALHKLL